MLRYDEQYYMGFILNFMFFSLVKEFKKSVKILRNTHHEFASCYLLKCSVICDKFELLTFQGNAATCT